MRFFKYLVFFFLACFCSFTNAAWTASHMTKTGTGPTAADACNAWKVAFYGTRTDYTVIYKNNLCIIYYNGGYDSAFSPIGTDDPLECWHPDYKIVSQDVNNSQIKTSICISNNGVMCKYVGNVKNTPVVNGYITTIFDSVSKTPDPNCKEEFANPPCDPKDPYGGCYTPPNQQCTRQSDGSIMCPDDSPEPDISKGCANGATYCDRPPTGCGDKYVPGTFNGKQICVKKSDPKDPTDPDNPDNPDNPDDPDGSGNDSNTSTSTSTSTSSSSDGNTIVNVINNVTTTVKIDISKIVSAIKSAASETIAAIKSTSKEIIYSIENIVKKLDITNSKIDEAKTKIDQTNSELSELNDKAETANDLLNDQNSKTDTSNDLLTQIKDAVNAIKDKGTGSDNGSGSGTGEGGSDKDCVSQGEYDDMSEASAAQIPTSKICKGEYHNTLDSINKNTKEIKDILSGESDGEAPEEHAVPMKELEQSSFVTDIIKVNAAYCPADKVINWQTPFGLFNKTISYQNLCSSSAWLGYLFMIAAYLWAAHIVVRDS